MSANCPRCKSDVTAEQRFCANCGMALEATSFDGISGDGTSLTAVGQVLDGRYRLRYLIGMGGMGAVYRAEVLGLGHSVAVKVLHPTLSADEECRARLENEARLASSIDHPNIVSILDFRSRHDLSYLVMEYLRGRSLAEVLADEGRLDVRRAIHIVRQILLALEAAHALDVLHRDLKPENIFLKFRANEVDDVKILDFGMATVMGALSARITGGDKVVGTPAYMSPEQTRGRELDHRTDLYSAAVVLYECLTGVNPFAGDTATDALLKQLTVSPKMPSKVCKEARIPPYLDALVMRSLRKDPVDRFASAAEFRRVLEGLVLARRSPPDTERAISTCAECGSPLMRNAKQCESCGTAVGRPVLGREQLSDLLSPELITALEESPMHEDELELAPTSTVTANPAVGWDPPLVGLDDARARIETLISGRRGGVLRIVGAPGAGKGRLARDASRYAERQHVEVHWVTPELRPFYASLRAVQRVVQRLLRIADVPEASDELIALARRAGVAPEHDDGLLEIFGRSRSSEPAGARREVRDAALVEIVRCSAQRGPLLLVVHDIGEMDAPSRELALALARADLGAMPNPVCVIITHRPELSLLWPETQRISVDPLSASRARQLSAELLASVGLEVDPQKVAAASQGSPLMIIELVRLLNLDPFARLPRSIAEVINRRINQLPPRARIVLHALAVVGRAESPAAVAVLIGEESADPGTLSLLAEQGFLRVSDRGWTPSHSVHRRVAYASTPASVRVSLHRAAAKLAVEHGNAPAQAAHHLLEAGDREAAVAHLLRGGWEALRTLDHGRAQRCFSRVLTIVPAPPTPFEDSGKAWTSATAGLSTALVDSGDADAAFELVRGAVRSAQEAGWKHELAVLAQHRKRLEERLAADV